MSIIATGRTCTRTGSATLPLYAKSYLGGPNCLVTGASLSAYQAGSGTFPTIGGNTPVISVVAYGIEYSSGGSNIPGTLAAVAFLNHGVGWDITGTIGPDPTGGGLVSWSWDAEEVVSFQLVSKSPQGSGENALPRIAKFVSLRPKVSGSYSVSLQVGSSALTASGTITSAMAAYVVNNYGVYNGSGFNIIMATGHAGGGNLPGVSSVSGTMTASVDGFSPNYGYIYNSGPSSSGSLFANFNLGISYSLAGLTVGGYSGGDWFGVPPDGQFNTATNCVLIQQIPWQFNLKGTVITSPPGVEPFSLKGNIWGVDYQGGSGTLLPTLPFTLSPSANATATMGGGTIISVKPPFSSYAIQQVVINPTNGAQVILDKADSNTNIETYGGQDTRMPIRMPVANGPTLSRSSRITLDPCNSISTPGTWTNVTVVGGHLQLDTSVHTTATGTYSTPIVSRQGRFLSIKLSVPYPDAYNAGTSYTIGQIVWYTSSPWKCIAPTTGNAPPNATYWAAVTTTPTISIAVQMVKGTVTYGTVTGGYGQINDVTVDLCCCPSYPGPDLQFSRYDYPSAPEGNTWGANTIAKITITLPASTGIYLIEEIAITTQTTPVISTMCGNFGYQSSSGSLYYLLGVISDVDGRRSLEQPAASSVVNASIPFTYYQLSNLASGLDSGWTYAYTPGSQWYDPSVAASPYLAYLGGGGATYQGGPVTTWIWNKWTQASQIPMQMMVDFVYGYPGMGDMCGGGGINGQPYIASSCKILRGTFFGLVATSTPTPISGSTVTSKEGTSVTGTGVSDSIGVFKLGTPGSLYSGDTISAGAASVSEPVLIRENRRIGLAGKQAVAAWHIQDDQGRLHLAVIHSGDVVYYRADFSNADQGWATQNTVTSYGDCVSARMAIDTTNRIWMTVGRLVSSVNKVYSMYSDNDGMDFTTGVLLASSAINVGPWTQNVSAVGMTWFVYNSGTSGPGVQKAQFSEGSGQAFGSVYTFKDIVNADIQVADGGWANVQEDKDYVNGLSWTPILAGGSAPTKMISTDTGKTWKVA